MARRSRPRVAGGQVSTSGNREMVKLRSPREGAMGMNGATPGNWMKPHTAPSLVATGPGIRGSANATPPNAYRPRASRSGRYADNERMP